MIIQFDKADLTFHGDTYLCLHVKNVTQTRQFVETMQDKVYDADLKIHRERRSLDANAYLWVLCQKIAETVRNITKEEVYQDAVKHVGQFEFLVFKDEAVETFIHRWSGHGLGWFAEKIDGGNVQGYTQVIAYYGSSVYNSKEMSVLLDYIVKEAKDLDIPTETPDKIAKMEALWEEK
jgi:hypothetical protein